PRTGRVRIAPPLTRRLHSPAMCTLLRLSPLLLLLLLPACLRTPPPNEHAIQNSDQCVQYMDMGDLERAQIHCELALQFAPQWAVAHLNMGLVHYTKGDF